MESYTTTHWGLIMNTSDLITKTCEELDRVMVATYISPGIVWGKTVNLTIGEFITGGKSLNFDEYCEAVIEHCKYLLHKYRIRWWECFSNNQRKRDIEDSLLHVIESLQRTNIIPLRQRLNCDWMVR